MNHPRPSLASQGVSAFLWGVGGSIARIFLQIGAQVALARILGPEVFGLFALGVLIVGVSTYFADFGLAYSLIQKQNVTDLDIAFVWTWQFVLGAAVALAIWVGAGPLATAFDKPQVEPVFAWLSLACWLNAISATSTNLMKKALDYKGLQFAQLASYLVGYILVGIPLAALDGGVNALIAAMLVQTLTSLAILYLRTRHPLKWCFQVEGGWSMLTYGLTVLATNLINWILTNADKLLVGRIFTAHVVGLYNTAFNLVNSPAAAAYGNLQSVVFSTCSRLQGDLAAMRHVFLRLVAGVLLFAFPLFAVLAAGSGIAMNAIYGPAWAEAAPYLRTFAVAMPCLLLWGIATPILWNTGRTTLEFQLQLPMVGLWVATLWLVAGEPGTTVAWAAAGLLMLRALGMTLIAARILRLSMAEMIRSVRGGLLLTIVMFAGSLYVLTPLAAQAANAQVQLALLLLAGGFAFLALLAVFGPWLIDQPLAATLSKASPRTPPPIALLIGLATRQRPAP